MQRLLRLAVPAALIACGPKDPPATFTEVADDLLFTSCALSSCHGSGTGELTLRSGDRNGAYKELVNVASVEDPALKRVKPGDPDNSYLIRKLEGHKDIVDEPMPPPTGLIASDPELVERVRSWIEDGAPDN